MGKARRARVAIVLRAVRLQLSLPASPQFGEATQLQGGEGATLRVSPCEKKAQLRARRKRALSRWEKRALVSTAARAQGAPRCARAASYGF